MQCNRRCQSNLVNRNSATQSEWSARQQNLRSGSSKLRPIEIASWCGLLALAVLLGNSVATRADDMTKKGTAAAKKSSTKAAVADPTMTSDAKSDAAAKNATDDSKPAEKVVKTEAEWRKLLKPDQYRVTRLKHTEPAFSGKYFDNKKPGKYLCVCCGAELYSSDEKFESGTGWPSFWAAKNEKAIETEVDLSHGMERTEVHCERCNAHLGHIFSDGPAPTGMRHCINSASLKFVAAPAATTKKTANNN